MNTLALSFVLGLAAAAANVFGGLLIVQRQWKREVLKYFIALGSGFMLATALLEMVPEGLRLVGGGALPLVPYPIRRLLKGVGALVLEPDVLERLLDRVSQLQLVGVGTLALVLGGYLLVHFFEHTITAHFHFGEEVHPEEMIRPQVGYAAVLGMLIHAFFDGAAIASGFIISTWLGAVVFLAVFLHKIPDGFTVASVMMASGRSSRQALGGTVLMGATTLVGIGVMWLLRAEVAYWLLVSAGATLYVAASDLMPEVNREPGILMAVWVFVGVASMLLLRWLAPF